MVFSKAQPAPFIVRLESLGHRCQKVLLHAYPHRWPFPASAPRLRLVHWPLHRGAPALVRLPAPVLAQRAVACLAV
jgi:hypothetical protein